MQPDAEGFVIARRTGNQTWLEDGAEEFVVDLLQRLRSGFPIGKDEIQVLKRIADRVEQINTELSLHDETCHRLQRLQAALGHWPRYERDLALLPGDMLLGAVQSPKGEIVPE